jgi:hypothetical protein
MSHLDSDSCNSKSVTHSFRTDWATAFKSADLAIFLHHINYWVDYNTRMKKNFHENRHWIYDTLEALHGHFPYWTLDQLRNIIKKLCDKGILIKGNFNQSKYDRTVWYTIDYDKIAECIWQNSQMEKAESPNQNGRIPTPIPNNKPNNEYRDISRKPYGSHVKLSDEEYQTLCSKDPKEKVDQIIQEINDHCVSNRPDGYPDYVVAFRTFSRNQNKTKGKNYGAKNQRKSNFRKTENPTGYFVNGERVE